MIKRVAQLFTIVEKTLIEHSAWKLPKKIPLFKSQFFLEDFQTPCMYAVHVSLLFFSYVSYFQIPLELKRIQYLHLDLFSVQLFFLPSSILR